MPNDNQSIEDLLAKKDPASPTGDDNEDKQGELQEKIGEIERAGTETEVAQKAQQLSLPYVDFAKTLIDREALALLSKQEIEQLKAVVFLNREGQIRMGTLDPTEDVIKKLDELAKANHAQSGLYFISEDSFQKALKEYDKIPKKSAPKKSVDITVQDLEKYKQDVKDLSKLPQRIKDIPLTDVMTIILAAGIEAEASDIHIEAEQDGIKLRLRLDGVLKDMAVIPREMWKQVISRIKLISRLKLNIEDKPQDGRISIKLPDDELDIRVSTLPTAHGESVVMRILRSSAVGLEFEALGIRGKSYNDLKREIERPNGMILTTGPTGSGKTTTLYAILNKLNKEGTKIITLEDPVEYKLKGINQSQIDKSKDYDFAKGLRSILRQDPDIVMVGEIRDLETADVAINAALTGHLVLSTLHTNDASGAIPRFLSMGVKPFLLSPSLNAVIGQRLVRKICEHCKEEAELTSDILPRVMKILESVPKNSGYAPDLTASLKFYKGKGCDKCREGYKGRIGVYEVFVMTPEIEKMVLEEKVSETDVKKITQEAGMISMVQDGILKALDGITSVDEVFRVTEE
ncbi:GspE/PulE family protein [Patescibacteria group bacterium]|nr:GspE/PulE family protein [Patescibacteria group bacterium]